MGAFCTVIVSVLVLINTIILVSGYTSQSRQTESSQTIFFDQFKAGKFYLEDYKTRFTIINSG